MRHITALASCFAREGELSHVSIRGKLRIMRVIRIVNTNQNAYSAALNGMGYKATVEEPTDEELKEYINSLDADD